MGLATKAFKESTAVRRRFLVTEQGVQIKYERPQTKARPTSAELGQQHSGLSRTR